ncbi:MAG: DNA-binding protein WhiA [Actinobacteria bacterium]|nr:DNA-binding protein WhiA [Actinomycetota bacterium]
MSFSSSLKNELARVYPGRRCCRIAELSGIIHTIGSLHILGDETFSLEAHSKNAAVARKIYRLLTELFHLRADVTVRRSILHRANDYLVSIPAQPVLTQALNELGILDDHLSVNRGLPARLLNKSCCAVAYLRGVFLGGGFASNPKGEYHFELATDNADFIEGLKELLERFQLHPGLVGRMRNYAVYLKGADEILSVLALVGAYNALLEWEDARIVKEVRAHVNRLVNCDTANLKKAATAAVNQIGDIELVDEEIGLERLPKGLRDIAKLRLENPSANIRELGELCEPPLNKQAVYHRIRRLTKLAESLRGRV